MKAKSFIKASTLFVVALFIALTFQSCNQPKQLTPAELEGYWVLKSLNGQEAKSVFAGAIPTFEFNFQDSLVYGTGGCNRYHGPFTYKEGIFSAPNLATTMMLCTEDNAESQFLLAISAKENILSIVNGILTISNAGKVTLEFEKGTPQEITQPASIDANTLAGTWTLKNINGADASVKFGESAPTMMFNFEDSRISGKGGCNTYGAKFTLAEGKLIVGGIISSRMACPHMEGEAEFTQAIADTSVLTFSNENVLQLVKNGSVILEFQKTTAELEVK